MNESKTNLQLSSPVYDKLKQVVQVILPGVGSLYLALGTIWGLPATDEVVRTCTAVALFLGLVLTVSSRSYDAERNEVAGALNVLPTEDDGKRYMFELYSPPEELTGKKSVKFEINDQT